MRKLPPTIETLYCAIKPIITFGASINASGRQRVINVCGELCDALERAIILAESYLQGAKYYKDDKALISYLQQSSHKLMNTYLEHNLCADMYSLTDRFKQVFDPTRYSISIPNSGEIVNLINILRQGERIIIDDFQEMIDAMSDLSQELSQAKTPDDIEKAKRDINRAIDYHLTSCKAHRNAIKRIYRKIIDGL